MVGVVTDQRCHPSHFSSQVLIADRRKRHACAISPQAWVFITNEKFKPNCRWRTPAMARGRLSLKW